jgi:membrane-bound lytic murein transglycosylase D
MALHISKSLAAFLCVLLVLAGSPAFARKGLPQDSLPGQRELVIAAPSGKSADTSLAGAHAASHSIAGLKNTASTKTPDRDALNDLHPQAIAFVRDYLDDNQQRLEKLKSWAGPYFVMIDQVLAKYQLPRELKYLAVIESNLKTTALSNKGAVGPWQFMPETGRLYGLKVNASRDERQDLYKSTHAAARYLRDLYKQLGDWLLVIAAYNGGDARVESAIRKAKSRDFWKLQYYLPAESRNHVKKFIATHYIMEGRGGVTTSTAEELAKMDNPVQDSALVAGTTTQVISGKYHSLVVAKTLGMDISQFQALNPGFDQRVSVGDYILRLPMDKMEQFVAMRQQMLGESVQFILANAEGTKEEYPDTIKLPAGRKTSRKGK